MEERVIKTDLIPREIRHRAVQVSAVRMRVATVLFGEQFKNWLEQENASESINLGSWTVGQHALKTFRLNATIPMVANTVTARTPKTFP